MTVSFEGGRNVSGPHSKGAAAANEEERLIWEVRGVLPEISLNAAGDSCFFFCLGEAFSARGDDLWTFAVVLLSALSEWNDLDFDAEFDPTMLCRGPFQPGFPLPDILTIPFATSSVVAFRPDFFRSFCEPAVRGRFVICNLLSISSAMASNLKSSSLAISGIFGEVSSFPIEPVVDARFRALLLLAFDESPLGLSCRIDFLRRRSSTPKGSGDAGRFGGEPGSCDHTLEDLDLWEAVPSGTFELPTVFLLMTPQVLVPLVPFSDFALTESPLGGVTSTDLISCAGVPKIFADSSVVFAGDVTLVAVVGLTVAEESWDGLGCSLDVASACFCAEDSCIVDDRGAALDLASRLGRGHAGDPFAELSCSVVGGVLEESGDGRCDLGPWESILEAIGV